MSETPNENVDPQTLGTADRISRLEELVAGLQLENNELKEELKKKTEMLMRELVQISAQQIQMLFENPVMASSIASNLLTALQNALMFQASSHKNRKPILLCVRDYVPSAMRVQLSEEGQLTIEKQEPNIVGQDAPWSAWPQAADPEVAKQFLKLVQSFGVDAGQMVYVVTDIALQEYRQELTEQIQTNAARIDVAASQN